MGRNTDWLVANRPTMVKVLTEIQRNFSYAGNGAANHDSEQFLECVSEVAATKNKRPRSIEAMRKAWRRWTTEGPKATTPPVLELALIVRYAKNRGWLAQLKHPDCVSLIGRLNNALVEDQASTKESSEIYWRAEVHKAFPRFDRFLEKQVTAPRGKERERNLFPSALVVQNEVGLMLAALVERAVRNLEKPREVFEDPQVSEAFLKPFEGWPDAYRWYASEISRFLNNEADYYEDIERALVPPQSGSSSHVRRKCILPIQPEDAGNQ
jgi:hypothetical protein